MHLKNEYLNTKLKHFCMEWSSFPAFIEIISAIWRHRISNKTFYLREKYAEIKTPNCCDKLFRFQNERQQNPIKCKNERKN